eukprot:TRINITY_DN4282_c1_g1_i1.p1 TRINITY_DN4282_c1_g1~~TRINITY_DN4282_c1_g1_i1.p1  ORF type:complete len:464 (-),score=125.33 TRINITY_DN4282_c1_g1_i1:34-1341(-)
MSALDMTLDDVIGKTKGGNNKRGRQFQQKGGSEKAQNTERPRPRRTGNVAAAAIGPAMKAAAAAAKAVAKAAQKPASKAASGEGDDKKKEEPKNAPKHPEIEPSKLPKGSGDKLGMSLDDMIVHGAGKTRRVAEPKDLREERTVKGRGAAAKLGQRGRQMMGKRLDDRAGKGGGKNGGKARGKGGKGGRSAADRWEDAYQEGARREKGAWGQQKRAAKGKGKGWDDEDDWGPPAKRQRVTNSEASWGGKGGGKGGWGGYDDSWGKGGGKGGKGGRWAAEDAWGPSGGDWGAPDLYGGAGRAGAWGGAQPMLAWDRVPPRAARDPQWPTVTSRAMERAAREEREVERPVRAARAERVERAEKPAPRKTIRVSNVPRNLDKRDIQEAFEDNGEVERCEVERGVAIITYTRASDAKKAVATFDRGELNGQTIFVAFDA